MQPDVIVAKLSQTILPSTIEDNETKGSGNQASSPRTANTTTAITSYLEQPWNSSNFFGAVYYSRKQYSTTCVEFNGEPGRQEDREEITVRYRGPAWLVNRAWQVEAFRSNSGWKICPRAFNIIPPDSFVFQVAEAGDVGTFRAMFQARQASPFDCDETGWTVLHVF